QLRQKLQRLDEIELRLLRAQQNRMRLQQLQLQGATSRLQRCTPTVRIQQTTTQLTQFTTRLHLALQQNLHRAQQRFAATSRALETLSPLSTLTRGYAIVTRTTDRRLITQSSDVAPGERITAQLKQGQLICIVEQRHE
ncbi:MAG: exodeoxyribonuclease VII large subunit, partial [Halothiobacillaceae bacterium]